MNTTMIARPRALITSSPRNAATGKPSLDEMLSLLRATLVGLGPIHPSLDLRSRGGKS
jgi:hypothetical protein